VTLQPARWESTAKSLLGKTTLLRFTSSNCCSNQNSCRVGTGFEINEQCSGSGADRRHFDADPDPAFCYDSNPFPTRKASYVKA
jgi:hypothetical protein